MKRRKVDKLSLQLRDRESKGKQAIKKNKTGRNWKEVGPSYVHMPRCMACAANNQHPTTRNRDLERGGAGGGEPTTREPNNTTTTMEPPPAPLTPTIDDNPGQAGRQWTYSDPSRCPWRALFGAPDTPMMPKQTNPLHSRAAAADTTRSP